MNPKKVFRIKSALALIALLTYMFLICIHAFAATGIEYYKALPQYHYLHIPASTPSSSRNSYGFNEYWWTHDNYRVIVYGKPQNVPGNTYKSGEYRYLGYDAEGNRFSNNRFPDDAISKTPMQDKNWISMPWRVGLCIPTIYSSSSDYQTDINRMAEYLGWSPGGTGIFFGYINVQSYPTLLASGSGTMWHRSGTSVWYDTQPIPPLPARQFDTDVQAAIQAPNTVNITAAKNAVQFDITLSGSLLDTEWYSNPAQKVLHYTRDDIKNWVFTLSYCEKNIVQTVSANKSNSANTVFHISLSRNEAENGDDVLFLGEVAAVYHNEHINSGQASKLVRVFVAEAPIETLPTTTAQVSATQSPSTTTAPPVTTATSTTSDAATSTAAVVPSSATTPASTTMPVPTTTQPQPSDLSVFAEISAPPHVYEGHQFYVSNVSHVESGGRSFGFEEACSLGLICDYRWTTTGCSGALGSAGGFLTGNLSSETPGSAQITLLFTDFNGNTHSADASVQILPCPLPSIDVSGYLKVNRKVEVSAESIFHPLYPGSTFLIEVFPVSTWLGSADIKRSASSAPENALYLFRKAGIYRAVVTVTDSRGHSGSSVRLISIEPDFPPISDIISANIKIRNPDNGNIATFAALDKYSRSEDGDSIQRRLWGYLYDSDNDGDFSEEEYVCADSSNLKLVNIGLSFVGKYQLILDVREMFGTLLNPQPTLPEFILPGDYLTDSGFADAEVDNVPPVAVLDVSARKKAEIKIVLGKSELADDIGNRADELKSLLLASGIDCSVEIDDRRSLYTISNWSSLKSDTAINYSLINASNTFASNHVYTLDNAGNPLYLSTLGGAALVDSDSILYFVARLPDSSVRIFALDTAEYPSNVFAKWQSSAAVPVPMYMYSVSSTLRTSTGIYRSKTDPDILYYYNDHNINSMDHITKFSKYTGEVVAQAANGASGYLSMYADISFSVDNPAVSSLDIVENFEVTLGTDRTFSDIYGNIYHVYYSGTTAYLNAEMADGTAQDISFGGVFSNLSKSQFPAGRFKMLYYKGKPLVFFTGAGTCGYYGNYEYYMSVAVIYGGECIQTTAFYPCPAGQDTLFSHGPEFYFARFDNKLVVSCYESKMYNYANVYSPKINAAMEMLRNSSYSCPGIRNDLIFMNEQDGSGYFTSTGKLVGIRNTSFSSFSVGGAEQRSCITLGALKDSIIAADGADLKCVIYVNTADFGDFTAAAELTAHARSNKNVFISVSNAVHRQQAEYLSQNTDGLYIDDGTGAEQIIAQAAEFIIDKLTSKDNSPGVRAVLVNEDVDYSAGWYDYENDPVVASRWKYIHDSLFFENGNGIASFHNVLLDAPVTNFGNKPGKYRVLYQVLDDPPGSSPGDWSEEEYFTVYVHRRPVCAVTHSSLSGVNQNPDGSYKMNTNLRLDFSGSYDPDEQSILPGRGIKGYKVVYKSPDDIYATEYDWPYVFLDKEGEWEFVCQVQDKMGVWSAPAEFSVTVQGSGNEMPVEKSDVLGVFGATIEGCWNHWRGQTDIFGKKLSVEPHRFLSLETVKINVHTTGYADRVVIRFSPELENMRFIDAMGNIYDYVEDFKMPSYVYFPGDSTFELNGSAKEGHVYWEYTLPLAASSVRWNDYRLSAPYKMTVYAYKGDDCSIYEIDDIDITGNVRDLVYTQPLN